MNPKPLIGISSCLLGQKVRYDGQHKRDTYLVQTLGPFVEWVPVCPEVEVGMGVPRETVRLVGDLEKPRMIAERSGRDWTQAMNELSRTRSRELLDAGICGFILKKDSPSCGFDKVRVYSPQTKMPRREGRGMFAQKLIDRAPLLPVEDEGRLNDPALRENFVERLFAYARWSALRRKPSAGALVKFHSQHKLILMAHDQTRLRRLGRLAAAKAGDPGVWDEYGALFMETLRTLATRRNHANTLYHALGYFSDHLSKPEKSEMIALIEDYRKGLLPLIVPVTMTGHHVKLRSVTYLLDQHYFNPHPKELMLRNHV